MTQHILMTLPYPHDALSPYISSETISYHYDKHHRTYLNNLNNLLNDLPNDSHLKSMSLEQLVVFCHGKEEFIGIFNNGAQVLNHDFYWLSMKPNGGGNISNESLSQMIKQDFGSIENFKSELIKVGLSQFGSGWVWLVQDNETKKLKVVKTGNGDNPILHGQKPIVTCDVWEHAYYIDYRNKRADYIETFLEKLINWEFVAQNLVR